MPVRMRAAERNLGRATMPTKEENDELASSIATGVTKASSVSGDAGSFTKHSLRDQIEAHRYLSSQTAARTPSRGIRFVKIENGAAHPCG